VGSIYYFEPERNIADERGNMESVASSGVPSVKLILSSITDDPLGPEGGSAREAQLLTFNEATAELQLLSADRLSGTCRTKLVPGSLVHLALPVVPGKAESDWWLDLVAQVVSCTRIDSENFKIVILLTNPAPGLAEKLAGTTLR
jgi:hypothetical protein